MFATFANAGPLGIERHFIKLIQMADQLGINIWLPGREDNISENSPIFGQIYPGKISIKIVLQCHDAVIIALKKKILGEPHHDFLFPGCVMRFYDSNRSPSFLLFDEDSKDGLQKAKDRYSMSAAIALLMFYAETKGVCCCDVCHKLTFNHTHEKITCSATCRQRKHRAKLKLKGE